MDRQRNCGKKSGPTKYESFIKHCIFQRRQCNDINTNSIVEQIKEELFNEHFVSIKFRLTVHISLHKGEYI